MSSSFVKDCSDASSSSSANTSKTVIIIVNNETGNVALDGNELQNLLASHGADTSQVSVVQMGSGGNVVPTESTPLFAGNFGGIAGVTGCSSELPLNFMVDGYSAIPIEGSAVGGYAELPLDADALKRLESVLETEEAKEILGDPLLDIVSDPNQLADQFDKLITSNAENRKEFLLGRKKRGAPKRRSQRQLDRAEREEVEKILAENQLMLRKEREELLREKEEEQLKEEEEESDTTSDNGEHGSVCEDSDENRQDVQVKNIKGKGKKIVTATMGLGKNQANTPATTGLGKNQGNTPAPTGPGKNQGNPATTGLGKNQGNAPATTGLGKNKGKPATPGLGKNQGNPATTGLGKNQGKSATPGLEKNQGNPATTGLGKNQGKSTTPGLGKNQGKSTTPGLGKNQGNRATTGLGKNQGKPTTPGLGKNQGNRTTTGLGKNQGKPATPGLGKNQGNRATTGLGKNQGKPATPGLGKNQGNPLAKPLEAQARGRCVKVIKGNKKLTPCKTEEKKNGKCQKKKVSPLIEGGNSKTLTKALQMKELSVKVKKLNESLLPKPPHAGEEGRSSALNEAAIPEETSKAGDLTTNGEAVPGGHSKDGEKALSLQLSPSSHESPTYDSKCKTIIKKGSKSACKTSIQSGLSDSSLPKVLNSVTHSALNQLDINSTQEPELELNNSDIPDTLRPCGDTNTLSEEKSDIINFDSKSTCQILIPAQNFSDKEGTLNSQKDLSQVKSACKQTAPPTDFNQSAKQSLNQSAKQTLNQSAVKTSKLKNKVTRRVKVLIPKEKSEVYILNSVILKSQKENLLETSDYTDDSNPKKISTRQSPIKIVPKVSKNQTQGKFISGKNKKPLSWKESERENAFPKAIHPQSPSISKSLMNYKIPLKTSSNKRPLLNHQMQSKHTLPPVSQPSLHTHRIPTPLVFKQTSTQSSESINTTNFPLTPLHPSDKSTPPINSLPSVGPSPKPKPLPFIDKSGPKPGIVLKNVNAKGNLSNPPISSPNQPSQINFTFNPQKNNTVTKTYPHLTKTKTVAENSVVHVKIEGAIDPKLVNKAIVDVPLHGKLLEGFKKSPSKIPPQETSKKGIRMSVGGNQIRRSGRPVKKKSFGDDILFFDEKSPIASEEEKDNSDSDEFSPIEKNHDGESPADDDISEEVDDDPERLWCTCQKPHNNRFMICCDRCEDWFHGSCVGITKPMGKQMEEDEREWICPNCKKAERAIKGLSTPTKKEIEKPSKVKVKSPEVKITQVFELKKSDKADKPGKKSPKKTKGKEKTEPRVLVYEKASGIVLSGTAAPTLDVLAEWLKANPAYTTLQPAMINSIKNDPQTGTKWINLEEFGLKPEKPAKLDRSLTFQQKIDSGTHAGSGKEKKSRVTKFLSHSEVMQMEVNRKNEGVNPKQLKMGKLEMDSLPKKKKNSSVLPQDKSSIEEASKRLSIDKNDIPRKNPELSKSNSVEENSPPHSSGVKKIVPKDFIKDPSLKKIPQVTPLKSPDAVDKVVPKSDVMNVRNSVRKMLFDALFKRKSEMKNEFTDMTPIDIKNLCQEIEEHLFSCFNKDVGFKYKSRYRSLMFNIRDTKNSGLYRKILNRTIPPERLAFMTSEELASRELAEWREREEKKELEAIKKNELERLALGNQYIMKSHKGEIVIDKEEFPSKSKDTESVINMAPDTNKTLPDPDSQDDPDMISHKNHIYDPSCKICTATTESQEGKKGESMKSSSQDGDREKRKNSSDSGRRESESSSSHPSKHKKKERERRHSHKSRNPDGSHERETEQDRSRERHKERDKGKDRERERSKERNRQKEKEKSRRSSKEMERRSSKDSHRHERKSSRDEKRKEEKKRRHSDPQRGDRKRRESESSFQPKEVAAVETKPQSKVEPAEIPERATTLPENDTFGLAEPPADQNNDAAPKSPASPSLSLDVLPILPPSWSNPISPIPPWERRFPSPEMVPDSPTYSPPDRSPTTPPLPVDIEDDDLLSPATPPLPEDEDRLTPPPMSTLSQKQTEKHVQMPIWKGIISMPDVAKFSAAAFEVSGKALFFTGDVPSVIEVVGRINPDIVWNYIAQMKKSGSKEILVVRFQPACEEEKVSYIALYSYLSSKKRYGVIGNCEKSVKDFYVVPLASHQPIPQALLPLDGPGFEESRPHMLIGVIIRIKHRRIYDPRTGLWNTLGDTPQHTSAELQEIESNLDESEKSFTPSPAKKKRISTSDDEDLEAFTPSPENTANGSTLPLKTDERGSKADRESMLAELNRQIERDRRELSEMQRKVDENMEKKTGDSPKSVSQDEEGGKGSSPARSEKDTGDSAPFNGTSLDTSKINIPSNLHEILASIKKKEEAIREKEKEIKRRLNLQQEEPKLTVPSSSTSGSKDVDLRLILGSGQDQDLRLLTRLRGPGGAPGLPGIPSGTDPRVPLPAQKDQDFRSRDPRIPREAVPPLNDPSNGPTLSKMSDADLLAKAMEMEEGQNVSSGKTYSRGPEHPPHMVGPLPEGSPLIHPPLQEGVIHPHPFGNPLPHPRFRHPGPDPYNMNPTVPSGAPAMGPPMPLPHAPSYRPAPLFAPPHPLEERMPLQCPPEEYPPYQRPPGIDERRSRIEEGHWDSRGARREWGCGDELWESRGWDMPPDRYPDDIRGRKRRWKEGAGSGPTRARWGNVEEDWRGSRSWRKDGKRSRKDRAWSRVGSHHDEPPPKEIDY